MRFLTVFLGCEDQHLCKDVGMIPYLLHKYHGYDSSILTYDNGPYPRLDHEVKGLRLVKIPRSRRLKKHGQIVDTLLYVAIHARDYDVLQLYHSNRNNRIIARLYKLLNPRGTTYLKLDGTNIGDHGGYDLATVETRRQFDALKETGLTLLPNGVDINGLPEPIPYGKKEKLIVHSGRLGDTLKASEKVVDAFAAVAHEYPDWKLLLVGDMPPCFAQYCRSAIIEYGLDGRVETPGYISSRKDLYDLYNRARVVFMPSLSESWCLALLECMSLGAVPLTSNIPVFQEITHGTGVMCRVDDHDCYVNGLRYIIEQDHEMPERSGMAIRRAREYDWKPIIRRLDAILADMEGVS